MHTLSVSALNEQIKGIIEATFEHVFVEGELSRITFHNSGHIYFTLKDADSSIKAVMFRTNAMKLKFELKEGLKVLLSGAVTLYKPRGEYQINCFSIEPSGKGALALAFEQLKEKLAQKGYFEPSRKKTLPKFPSRIALITSATGAALQDMLRVANSRYRLLEIDIYDVLVQGENASFAIVNAIALSDTKNYDLIIIGRGGGSIEDLWAFNEERVADAIFLAQTPIISAVGHEIDWLISDFVADVRAATPSAAMEIALPDMHELYQTLDSIEGQLGHILMQKIASKRQDLLHLTNSYAQHSIEKKLSLKRVEIQQIQENFHQNILFKLQNAKRECAHVENAFPSAIEMFFKLAQNQVIHLTKMLESNHPKFKIKKGFAQISKNKKVIDISGLKLHDDFELQSDAIRISAKVTQRQEI